jgi:hypothetical protein
LRAQSRHHGRAAVIRIIDLSCGTLKRKGIVRIVLVKGRDPVKTIGEIRE